MDPSAIHTLLPYWPIHRTSWGGADCLRENLAHPITLLTLTPRLQHLTVCWHPCVWLHQNSHLYVFVMRLDNLHHIWMQWMSCTHNICAFWWQKAETTYIVKDKWRAKDVEQLIVSHVASSQPWRPGRRPGTTNTEKKAAFKQIEETVKQNRSRKNWAFWLCSREVLGEQRGRRGEKIARQLVWNRKDKQKWCGDEERVYRSLLCSINSDDSDISMLRHW